MAAAGTENAADVLNASLIVRVAPWAVCQNSVDHHWHRQLAEQVVPQVVRYLVEKFVIKSCDQKRSLDNRLSQRLRRRVVGHPPIQLKMGADKAFLPI